MKEGLEKYGKKAGREAGGREGSAQGVFGREPHQPRPWTPGTWKTFGWRDVMATVGGVRLCPPPALPQPHPGVGTPLSLPFPSRGTVMALGLGLGRGRRQQLDPGAVWDGVCPW